MLMSFSIRQKLFVLLAGLAALVIAGVLSSVSSKLGEAILKKVEHDFKQSDVAFKRERKLHAEKLLEAATLFGESTSFKANVKLNDTASVYEFVNDLSRHVLADLFVVTDDEGRLLSWWGDPDRHGEDLTKRASVAGALAARGKSL